jgi:triacylglycerol lipase
LDKENKVLKYPLVLVHGISCHDRKSVSCFWGRIPKVLRNYGVEIYFGNTDAWGSYESNAEMLKNTIEKILAEKSCEKVNILAHSKGGIDARYLIWRYNFGEKIASLITVSTPHHGAEIADFISKQKIIYSKPVRLALKLYEHLYGDTNPDLYTLLSQLTTEKMKDFNQKVSTDEKVYYQSFYTVMKSPLQDLRYFYNSLYIQKISGANDGIVSEKSASWGNKPCKMLEESISHRQVLDVKKKTIYGIDIPYLYVNIIRELASRGF